MSTSKKEKVFIAVKSLWTSIYVTFWQMKLRFKHSLPSRDEIKYNPKWVKCKDICYDMKKDVGNKLYNCYKWCIHRSKKKKIRHHQMVTATIPNKQLNVHRWPQDAFITNVSLSDIEFQTI
tara:strand:- start:69 stop:431 length:363 start_codon:yes stop_codon:yes gene_type:complete